MKHLILPLLIGLLSVQGFSQESKLETATFKVEGVCGMCEDRIEEAANLSKGVKSCDWNKETKEFTVTFKTNKTSKEEIAKALAGAGHDNELVKATDKEYSKIHKCCRYREMESH